MSGTVSERKRLLRVTLGNLRHSHIYINGHYDFFPADCRKRTGHSGKKPGHIDIFLEGMNETVETEIALDAKTGKPRGFFRGRKWVRQFFERHGTQVGDVLALERTAERRYRLYPFDVRAIRTDDWRTLMELPLEENVPTVLELFAGCGGTLLGFKNAGFQTVLANEWDEAACDTIRRNLTLRVAQCAVEEIHQFPRADVVVGGPPCQGFSNLGERVPNDPRRQLWRHFLRAVADAQPVAFVMENVPPLLKSQEFVEIAKCAEAMGYSVEGRIVNAADYGVPQTRKRAILIGARGTAIGHPDPTHFNPACRDVLTQGLRPWKTVREAIGALPFEPDGVNWHVGRNPTSMSLERYRHIPPGGNRWDLPDVANPQSAAPIRNALTGRGALPPGLTCDILPGKRVELSSTRQTHISYRRNGAMECIAARTTKPLWSSDVAYRTTMSLCRGTVFQLAH